MSPRSGLIFCVKNVGVRKKGSLAVSDCDNAGIMGKHFEKVFNNHKPIDLLVLNELEQQPTLHELGEVLTEVEIKSALRKIANGKSPGKSRIIPESVKRFR